MNFIFLFISLLFSNFAFSSESKTLILEFLSNQTEGNYVKLSIDSEQFEKLSGKTSILCNYYEYSPLVISSFIINKDLIKISSSISPERKGRFEEINSFDDLNFIIVRNSYKVLLDGIMRYHRMSIFSEASYNESRIDQSSNHSPAPRTHLIPTISINQNNLRKQINSFDCQILDLKESDHEFIQTNYL